MAEFKSYKKESHKDWGNEQSESLNIDQITLGAILRIADSVEAMAVRYTEIIDQNQRFKKRIEVLQKRNYELWRSNYALRGHITRLKKQRDNK
jgi:hypothetical protein